MLENNLKSGKHHFETFTKGGHSKSA